MRHIVGLLSVMLTCFALTTLHAAAASIEGSWIGSGTVSRRANVDRVQCRVRYTKSSENNTQHHRSVQPRMADTKLAAM